MFFICELSFLFEIMFNENENNWNTSYSTLVYQKVMRHINEECQYMYIFLTILWKVLWEIYSCLLDHIESEFTHWYILLSFKEIYNCGNGFLLQEMFNKECMSY